MIDYYETISQPIIRNGNSNIHNVLINFVIEQEEPYEGRLSRTVPWERRGETPLRDPTMGRSKKRQRHSGQTRKPPEKYFDSS